MIGRGVFLLGLGFLLLPGRAAAQDVNALPPELQGVDIVDSIGKKVPLDLEFTESTGEKVTLGSLLAEGRPAILQLAYYNCPMLCSLVMNGYVEGARKLEWSPGREYTVITVSFDPADELLVAAQKKKNYVGALGRPEADAGWHFLIGAPDQIAALTEAVGFKYRWLEDKKQFAHAAALFVLTPDGRVSRILYGTSFSARDLRLSLLEAGEGRLGSPLEKLLLYCFHYDDEHRKYALVALNVMKLGGLLTVAILGGFLGILWSRERRRVRAAV